MDVSFPWIFFRPGLTPLKPWKIVPRPGASAVASVGQVKRNQEGGSGVNGGNLHSTSKKVTVILPVMICGYPHCMHALYCTFNVKAVEPKLGHVVRELNV